MNDILCNNCTYQCSTSSSEEVSMILDMMWHYVSTPVAQTFYHTFQPSISQECDRRNSIYPSVTGPFKGSYKNIIQSDLQSRNCYFVGEYRKCHNMHEKSKCKHNLNKAKMILTFN